MMVAEQPAAICPTSSHESASPPQKRYFFGSISVPRGSASKAVRCEGVIFNTSIGWLFAYSANAFAFIEVSKSTTCRQPPDAQAGKIEVFPRSALTVETV